MAGIFAQNTISSAMEDLMTHIVFIAEGKKKYTIHLGRQQIKVSGGTRFSSGFRELTHF